MATGLIQDEMARPEGEELTTEAVTQNIQMPPELQRAYDRVVVAGMKIMFGKDSHKLMLKELQREGPLAQKLGQGIAGLVLLLYKESNGTMPPAVMIPAGVYLTMQAVDFMRQADLEKVTNQDIGDAMEIMVSTIMEKFGVAPEKLQSVLSQFDNQNVDAAAQQMGV
jgi:hypothetical protein